MAGAGFKTFNTGDVLSASDVNTYLMQQTVMVFADSTARSTALGANVAEGMVSYLKSDDTLYTYNGSAWVAAGATGDITAVTAGTGISGGGTSGDVTITNSMATAIDAKGDLIAGTAADTFSRLAVGADYSFLSALASESTGLKWSSDWTSWTPTISGATTGNGTVTAKYLRLGKSVIARFDFFLGSTSSVTGDFYFSLPFSVASGTRVTGFGMMYASIGVVPAVPEISGSNMYLRAMNASGTYVVGTATSSTIPGTWAATNWLAATCVYEVA